MRRRSRTRPTLFGTFNTGSIKHSIATGFEVSWEKARRGTYIAATGSTISPRCTPAALARYYCASLFNPNPDDPRVNYASDTSAVLAPIVRNGIITQTQNEAHTMSVYGFDSITLVPQLILNLGVRYDDFTSKVTPGQAYDQHRLARPQRQAVQLAGRAGVQADRQQLALRQLRHRRDAAEQPAGRRQRIERAADDDRGQPRAARQPQGREDQEL